MTKQHIQLTPQDRDTLTTQGDQKARLYKRALGLLERDRGKPYPNPRRTMKEDTHFCQALTKHGPPSRENPLGARQPQYPYPLGLLSVLTGR